MLAQKFTWFWTTLTILLLVFLIVGIVFALSRYNRASKIEISIQPDRDQNSLMYITGNVSMPGLYPFSTSDTIGELLKAAGGPPSNSDIEFRLNVSSEGAEPDTQKIDVNRADVWLLQALPGIGEVLAQRIVDYRNLNGLFHNTSELMKIAGISNDTFNKIQGKITVSDR
jgi:competence protein ComEA